MRKSDEIHLTESSFIQTVLIHEVGHMLDIKALGSDRYRSSLESESELYKLREAIRGTLTWKNLHCFRSSREMLWYQDGKCSRRRVTEEVVKHAETYLASMPECFARLYLQWIASKPGNEAIHEQFQRELELDHSRTFLPYWTRAETERLFPELEGLFQSRGWLEEAENKEDE